jgi:hypothetical protein
MEAREITQEEREALHRFLKLELSFHGLLSELHGMVEIEFLPTKRVLKSHFKLVEPPVPVTKSDVRNAVNARKSDKISEREIVRWATMLVMNEAYVWKGQDEDEIGDALNDLSIGGIELYQRNRPSTA